MHFAKPAQWGDWPPSSRGGCGQQSPGFYKTSTWVRQGCAVWVMLGTRSSSTQAGLKANNRKHEERGASEKCWLMPVLPVPKFNLSVPCFYKFTKTMRKQASSNCNTHMSHGTINIPAWKVMKSCLLRRDQMKFPETTPCFVLQLHPKLNLHDVSLIPATKKRKN